MVLVCQATLQDHVNKELSNFMSEIYSRYSSSPRFSTHKQCGVDDMLKEFVSTKMIAKEMGKKVLFESS